ncbi:MAG: hypothetical protein R6X11_01675 [Desulfonatronovibrio sp.]
MSRLKFTGLLVVFFVFLACPGFAGDLVGTWVHTESWGARAGDTDHNFEDGDHWIVTEKSAFYLKITEQSPDGRAFHGEWCSPDKCEDLVGVVSSDNSMFMVDEDGYFNGRILGEQIEVCYQEAGDDFRIASCRLMEKK